MEDPAIVIERLSKRYEIGGPTGTTMLRETVVNLLRHPFAKRPQTAKFIWALKDVSFEVPQGEILGIVGRNGSGKSTLLRILAKISRATSGTTRVRGRVASLLEVGTGFHDELTGRENIYLSGSLLGMSRKRIDARFEEIVAFAGVEQFIG